MGLLFAGAGIMFVGLMTGVIMTVAITGINSPEEKKKTPTPYTPDYKERSQ